MTTTTTKAVCAPSPQPQEKGTTPATPTKSQLVLRGEIDAEKGALVYPSPEEPYEVAKAFLERIYVHNGIPLLCYWRGNYWYYRNTHWSMPPGTGKDGDLELITNLYEVLSYACYKKEGKVDGSGKPLVTPWKPNDKHIKSILHAIKPLIWKFVDPSTTPPVFISRSNTGQSLPGQARDYVSLENGLLHLPTKELHKHTPQLFTTYSLPFKYDPQATCPHWNSFLATSYGHDPKAIDLLQEYAGYLLSGRTHLQKALIITGVPRSGKGVTLRLLKKLVGKENTTEMSLGDMGEDTAQETCIGKTLCTISEAIDPNKQQSGKATDFLLRVTGQDEVNIARKYIPSWVGALGIRFLFASNNAPRFKGHPGAILSRFAAMHLPNTFEGNEDRHLEDRIGNELPGIFNWALEGLERLNQQGEFTVPKTQAGVLEKIGDRASSWPKFIEECLEVTGAKADMVPKEEMYNAVRVWHNDAGMYVPNKNDMWEELPSANSSITAGRIRTYPGAVGDPKTGKPPQKYYFTGVRLKKGTRVYPF